MRRFLSLATILLTALVVTGGSTASPTPECGAVLTSDVVLTESLVCAGDALTVAAGAEVTLDLNGHAIVGSGSGTGITVNGPATNPVGEAPGHVTIQDGSVHGFTVGIRVLPNGFNPPGSASVQLERLFVRGNGTGVSGQGARGGPAVTLADSTIASNHEGVVIGFMGPIRMIDDRVRNNGGNGISAAEDSLRLLQDSFIAHNGGLGAELHNTVATISGNTFLGNGDTGLSISEELCSLVPFYGVSNNVANNNGGGGIRMTPLEASCSPAPPPGGGNAAKHNAVFQCVLIVCALNRRN
jgi:hypothetical protein